MNLFPVVENLIYNENKMVRAGYPRIPFKVALHRLGLLGTLDDPRNDFDRQDPNTVDMKEYEDRCRTAVFDFIDNVLDDFECVGKMSMASERVWAWLVHSVREGPWHEHVIRRLFAPEHERSYPFLHAMESIILQRCYDRRARGHQPIAGWLRELPHFYRSKCIFLTF